MRLQMVVIEAHLMNVVQNKKRKHVCSHTVNQNVKKEQTSVNDIELGFQIIQCFYNLHANKQKQF